MLLETVQKPVKMSFNIADLAKSSRNTSSVQSEAVVYNVNCYQTNVNGNACTPEKLQAQVAPMTSTPLSITVIPSSERLLKRKQEDESSYPDDSSSESSDTKSDNSISSACSNESGSDEPKKKSRCLFTSTQVKELEKRYKVNRYLPIEERSVLAKRLGLSQQQVKTWFQNRRMKAKRQQKTVTPTASQKCETGTSDQFVAFGSQCPPSYHLTQFSGFYNHQLTGTPITQMFDPASIMCGYGPVSPIIYAGYNPQFYNGLSPQPTEQYRM